MQGPFFLSLQQQAEAEGKICVVGALILDRQGRIFAQRRSMSRRLFPGCWDMVGGHVETGETLLDALRREIQEETGWTLASVVSLIAISDWNVDGWHREFDFYVEVEGDLTHPELEWNKHTEYRWLSASELAILEENRRPAYPGWQDIARKAIDAWESRRKEQA
ncbi:hypothetical protein EI42_03515 [Thermosporothrix hazakensis]|jgi:8-oxo-dGTP pyrophosphatase MutT (NUDIX family)|uniref:Nudix hydrolase domain-containing protein n=2 Tax=Thermosporothrix TaxID=768650 RepID=A0A326U437_THEHA|nr:NUDIX domain-containing protein [Thermosporothrix hazakensis]PZW27429.1 hypothetical protein EI42_03515 [Thermosporothrix hazakensis]BBH85979.1 hypothetical protein KTC_07300 [Thermosporothrix sp. COM3]GCE45596.1 hypothetical protein KTH_04650 [Thermosporothrix hazakensis]